MTTNRLQAVLDRATTTSTPVAAPASAYRPADPAPVAAPRPAVGAKTVLVGAHLPPPYLKQLRLIAAEEGVTINTLLREALDLLFVKKGKDRVVVPTERA